jgi:hypothetical protein
MASLLTQPLKNRTHDLLELQKISKSSIQSTTSLDYFHLAIFTLEKGKIQGRAAHLSFTKTLPPT